MPSKSPFTGTPLGFADTINGAGVPLSGIDCGNGVNAGAKCFVAAGLQYWTLTVSNAVVDHTSVEAALNFPVMRWILDGTPGTGTISNITSSGGTITVTTPTGPTVNVEVTTPAPGFGGAPPAVAAASAAGAAATASRSDHTHQGVKSVTAGTGMTNSGTALDPVLNVTPSGTVTSVASADGSVVITNPTTTPDLSVRVVTAATAVALAALVTVGKYQTGQQAFVTGDGHVYVLRAATAGAANGINVLATSDDASKQWVWINLLEGASYSYMTAELDLTTPSDLNVWIPAVSGCYFFTGTTRIVFTQTGGTYTAGPTRQAGNDAAETNFMASSVSAFATLFATGAPANNQEASFSQAVRMANLSTGITLKISAGATGVALVLRGRYLAQGYYLPIF